MHVQAYYESEGANPMTHFSVCIRHRPEVANRNGFGFTSKNK